MTLDLKLTIDRTDLRYQEDVACRLTLANRGSAPLSVPPHLGYNPALLRLRTIDVKTGAETVHAPPPNPLEDFDPPNERPLKAGESLSAVVSLMYLPKVLLPGDYDVSAIVLYNGKKERAESAPVRVRIRPTTPRNLFYLHEEGHGAWVNVHADPPEVLLMSFETKAGGGARRATFIAPASLQAAPVFSVGPFDDPVMHRWVAWIEGGQLKTIHHHYAEGPGPLRAFPLASPKDVLVPPLHSDSTPDDNSRPGGAALLYRESGELETVKLGHDKTTSLARAPLPGPRPLWISSFERAGNKRTVLLVRASGDKVALSEAPWPGSGGAVRALGEWPGTFMGAGASVDGDNVLGGTLLLRQLSGARLAWDRIDFTLDAKGTFASTASAGPVSDPADPFDEATSVRLGAPGEIAALLKTSKGFWWVYDGAGTFPVPHDLRQTPYPLDVNFLNGQPVLIAGFKEAGFHMRMADGNPLPPPSSD